MALHEVAFTFELLEAFVAREEFAGVGKVLLDQLLHLLFDLLEIFGSERGGAVEVVEESGFGGGAVTEFGLREKLEYGGGEQVRGGVAIDLERLGIFVGEDAEIGVFFQRTGEIDQIAIRFST